jgi:hypothetical protein
LHILISAISTGFGRRIQLQDPNSHKFALTPKNEGTYTSYFNHPKTAQKSFQSCFLPTTQKDKNSLHINRLALVGILLDLFFFSQERLTYCNAIIGQRKKSISNATKHRGDE